MQKHILVLSVFFLSFSLGLNAKDSSWADKRVNSHLQNTGMNIYMQEQSVEVQKKSILLDESLEGLEISDDRSNSYGLMTEEEKPITKDFSDSSYSARDLRSPSNQLRLDVEQKREQALASSIAREMYLRQFLKNIREAGHTMDEVK